VIKESIVCYIVFVRVENASSSFLHDISNEQPAGQKPVGFFLYLYEILCGHFVQNGTRITQIKQILF